MSVSNPANIDVISQAHNLLPRFESITQDLKIFWGKVYVKPIASEKGWSTVSLVRGVALATLSWIAVLGPWHLVLVVAMDAARNYYTRRYIQTIRNMFLYHNHFGPIKNFTIYYSKRLAFNILTGFLLLLAAFGMQSLSIVFLVHLVSSRLFNSTHYLVGNIEANMVKSGILSRGKLAHIEGSLSMLGTVVAQTDLAGIEIFGVRPCFVNLFISACLAIYYGKLYREHLKSQTAVVAT